MTQLRPDTDADAATQLAVLRDTLVAHIYRIDLPELQRLADAAGVSIAPEAAPEAAPADQGTEESTAEFLDSVGLTEREFDDIIEGGRAAIARGEGVTLAQIQDKRLQQRQAL